MYYDLSLPFAFDRVALHTSTREEALARLGHHGTHLDRVIRTEVPLEYCKSRAIKIDTSSFAQTRAVEVADLPLDLIQAGDFILLHNGAMQRHGYGAKGYQEEFFELSWDALHCLLERKIHYIGLDSRGVRQGTEHREADIRAEKAGTYVIENLKNTEKLPLLTPFTIYAVSFDLGGTGVPCRVIAEVAEVEAQAV